MILYITYILFLIGFKFSKQHIYGILTKKSMIYFEIINFCLFVDLIFIWYVYFFFTIEGFYYKEKKSQLMNDGMIKNFE